MSEIEKCRARVAAADKAAGDYMMSSQWSSEFAQGCAREVLESRQALALAEQDARATSVAEATAVVVAEARWALKFMGRPRDWESSLGLAREKLQSALAALDAAESQEAT